MSSKSRQGDAGWKSERRNMWGCGGEGLECISSLGCITSLGCLRQCIIPAKTTSVGLVGQGPGINLLESEGGIRYIETQKTLTLSEGFRVVLWRLQRTLWVPGGRRELPRGGCLQPPPGQMPLADQQPQPPEKLPGSLASESLLFTTQFMHFCVKFRNNL